MMKCQTQKVEESVFSLTAWGRGTRVAPKLLPDFFPKVGGMCPGLAVGSGGSGNLTWTF